MTRLVSFTSGPGVLAVFQPGQTARRGCGQRFAQEAGRTRLRFEVSEADKSEFLGLKYLLRRCLGWVWRFQIPSEEVLGGVGNKYLMSH